MDIWQKLIDLEEKSDAYGLAWPSALVILEQIESECLEIREHLEQKKYDEHALQEEIGDLMHAVMSLAWFCQFDAHTTLKKSCQKFARRFDTIKLIANEKGLDNLQGLTFEELMVIWNEAKKRLTIK